jgi:hypothetical protein
LKTPASNSNNKRHKGCAPTGRFGASVIAFSTARINPR